MGCKVLKSTARRAFWQSDALLSVASLRFRVLGFRVASVLAGAQGGTCLVIGDDHAWVAEASRLAQERINCTLLPLQPFYRREGHHQARLPCCRSSAAAAITMSLPLLSYS